jgi:sodium-coupled neutral amino acid transporter 11
LGIVLSIAVAMLTWLALYILIISGKKINVYKYAILCEATMGRFGFYLLNSVIFFQSAGACITYMIVVGDTIPIILDILGFAVSRRWVILVSSLLFVSNNLLRFFCDGCYFWGDCSNWQQGRDCMKTPRMPDCVNA